MSAQILRQLGRYELLRRVAAGGMGEIFLARMRGAAGFEKRVIIKTILPHLAEEEEFIEKFLDEGRIVVQLTHGNIVPVFDMGEEHGEFFIAMEYIPGRDVRDLIKRAEARGETLSQPIALHVIAETCKGLGYAHRKRDERDHPLGLVHRDVSPSNVLISSEGEVKLIDFGIARATTKLSRTVSGRIQGKFSYMSPEQASGREVDARSDIFSVGVMLYEMLTGQRPFDGESDLETLDRVRSAEFDAPSVLNAQVPEEIDAIVARAMARDVSQRYSTIDAMQAELLGYLYGQGCAPTSTEVVAYLNELFEGDIERRDLRSHGATPLSEPQGLDDILGAELDRMLEESGSAPSDLTADPFTRTDASLPSLSAGALKAPHHTATLQADVSQGAPQWVEPVAPSAVTPSPATPSPPDFEARSLQEGEERDASSERVASEGESLRDQRAPSGAAQQSVEPTPRARHALALLALLALLGGTLSALLAWQRADLGPALRAEPDMRRELDVIASPPSAPEPPRRVQITTNPAGAMLMVDGRELGQAPQPIEIPAGETVIVYARRAGCEDADVTLSHRYESEQYAISMLCFKAQRPEPEAADNSKQGEQEAARAVDRPRHVIIRAEPRDAIVTVNRGAPQKGTFMGRFAPSERLVVRVYKQGYEPYERTLKAGDLKRDGLSIALKPDESKCLDLRLMEVQVADEVEIDGRSIGPVRSSKRGVSVSPGTHTVRAVNAVAGRDERVTVTVPEDATRCVNVVLFPLR